MPHSVSAASSDVLLTSFDLLSYDYFKFVLSYNGLVLAPHFYETFTNYKYILLYQLDARFREKYDRSSGPRTLLAESGFI